jgi:ADYC domain
MRRIVRLAALLALALAAADAAPESGVSRVEVVGTEFRVVLADGTMRRGRDLVGAVLTLGGHGGLTVRIDSAEIDPLDGDREVWLYGLSKPGSNGAWVDLCPPDPEGVAKGFPLSGAWTASGEHVPSRRDFSLTCTAGASGKCVRLGYKPWKIGPSGESLWDYHQACVRLLRADYCGDGTPHTRPGIPVTIYDRISMQSDSPMPSLGFEAAWGPGSAICLRKTRLPKMITPEDVKRVCPAHVPNWIGEGCTEERARSMPSALLFNRS